MSLPSPEPAEATSAVPEAARPSLAEVAARLEREAVEQPAEATAAAVTANRQPAPVPAPGPELPPRATRLADGSWLGGVCSGLAAYLGWPVTVLRTSFVVLAALQLVGVAVYAVLWLVLPLNQNVKSPGLEAANRSGMRSDRWLTREIGPKVALAMLGTGLVWLQQTFGFNWYRTMYWPLVLGCVGVALVWRQADGISGDPTKRRTWRSWFAITAGVGLVGLAVMAAVALRLGVSQATSALWVAASALVGVFAVSLPWAFRTRSALSSAREKELLANARADVAAHLHDSVLQTLALIQLQADDPKAVAALARKQERELRQWLYGEDQSLETFDAMLRQVASEVEDSRAVAVDLVVVGNADLDPALDALVRAAREAILNAAKHSGADRIDVYAEVTPDLAEVYVRDRGRGFDVDAVQEDRMGIRYSIIDRMARHGGTARLRSTPADGTEVRLTMERE